MPAHERHQDVAVTADEGGFAVAHAPHAAARRQYRDGLTDEPQSLAEIGRHIAYQTRLLDEIARRLDILV